jgi:hypothetical protein
MYSLQVLRKLIEELNLKLEDNYDKKDKYISTTKFNLKCTFDGCNEKTRIKFDALLRSKKAYCKTHRYHFVSDKIKKTSADKNKPIYDENKKKLYKLIEELHTELVEDYSDIDIKNDTDICYKCIYDNCNETGTKQYHTLLENKKAYCNEHHYLLHNSKINENLRKENQEKYNKYNDILDKFKNKYPQVNLSWNRDSIWSQAELTFNCINPKCNILVSKLFQHILQNEENINEVYFGCEECKFYISESLNEDATLLKNTQYYNELVEYPKQIDYITTHCSLDLKWTCGKNCINCNKKHIYASSPHYRSVQWGINCPLCIEPNKCNCVNEGFICRSCNLYFADRYNKSSCGNICKICLSRKNDDNLEKIFKRKIQNCKSICKNKEGNKNDFDLDVEYLQQLYQEQKGLCYISKIQMSLKVHSDFNISIERIDETDGYVKGNIKFICIEFQNGQQQWTPTKFHDFCKKIDKIDKENINKKYNTKHSKKRKIQQNAYNNVEKKECLCRKCDLIQNYDKFSKSGIEKGICKECHKILNAKRTNNPSLRQKLKILVSSSKSGIEKRNNSKWRINNPLTHSLSFEELLEIYLQQYGRCAYSNKLLELCGEYMMSLERKDTNIGYTKENCCLICIEFNTTDWSIAKCDNDDREGSSGWNKEKLKSVVDNYLQNYNT